ncbi:MAG: PEGA domain-containing protein [Lachnospiraceae bacterium]|nr:PEGA domain-containing protein [Lachnospiraceae bacterium]
MLKPDKKPDSKTTPTPASGETAAGGIFPDSSSNVLEGIITSIDLDSSELTVSELGSSVTHVLTYTGGTDVRTRSRRPITVAQLNKGDIVQVSFNDDNRLSTVIGSSSVWTYKNVANAIIDGSIKKLTAGSSVYRFDDSLKVMNGDEFVPLETLNAFDSFHLYGIDNYLYLIKVATGHGYLSFANAGDFIGGSVSYSTGKTVPLTENFLLTLSEGEYLVTVQNGDLFASATVKISRDTTTYFDLFEYSAKPVPVGNVTFKISPAGSDLYIDGVKTLYANPVRLSFGDHSIEASLGGYTSYFGSITVDRTDIVKNISLSEAPGNISSNEDLIYEDSSSSDLPNISTPTPAGSSFNDSSAGGPAGPSGNIDTNDVANIDIPDSTTDDGDMDNLELIDGDSDEAFSGAGSQSSSGNVSSNNDSFDNRTESEASSGTKPDNSHGNDAGSENDSSSENIPESSDNSDKNSADAQDNASDGPGPDSDSSSGSLDNTRTDSDNTASENETAAYHGTMTIYTSNGCSVYVDGVFKGTIENGSLTLPKPSGTIEIGLSKEGYVSKKYTLTMDDDEENTSFKFPEMTKAG